MFKSNKDKEVTIPLNMKYIYSGEYIGFYWKMIKEIYYAL